VDVGDEPVLIIGVAIQPSRSSARVQAWRALLHEVAHRAHEQPLRARVLECPRLLPRCREARDKRSAVQADEVFSLVARHPLMTRYQVAALLRTSTRRIARLESDLIERGWLRPVPTNDHLILAGSILAGQRANTATSSAWDWLNYQRWPKGGRPPAPGSRGTGWPPPRTHPHRRWQAPLVAPFGTHRRCKRVLRGPR
jgi:hypothetical protein